MNIAVFIHYTVLVSASQHRSSGPFFVSDVVVLCCRVVVLSADESDPSNQ